MKFYNHIIETIGNTPMVKLNKVVDTEALVLAKVESFNPGHSTKDRMALKMVEDAEKDGLIKEGGTIIEGTSGNTGMGLALACIQKGYKLICTISDKQSKEKMDILKAMGAEVYVCPTNVAPEHPESYYSVVDGRHRIALAICNGVPKINVKVLNMPKIVEQKKKSKNRSNSRSRSRSRSSSGNKKTRKKDQTQ